MSQVLVWKADEDGKLFEDHTKYLSHLRFLSRARAEVRKQLKIKLEHEQYCAQMGQSSSIPELIAFISNNWSRHEKNSSLLKMHMEVRWQDRISNTHSCPRGGMTNFRCDQQLPLGYAGWLGRLRYTVNYKKSDIGTLFREFPIYTGSGGGSNYIKNDDGTTTVSYGYEMILWADDYPELFSEHEKSVNWVKLGGAYNNAYLEN